VPEHRGQERLASAAAACGRRRSRGPMEMTVEKRVAVVMQRLPLDNRWQPWRWRPLEVVEHDLSHLPDQLERRCLMSSEVDSRWLFGGFEVGLFRDEAEGYFLNVDSE